MSDWSKVTWPAREQPGAKHRFGLGTSRAPPYNSGNLFLSNHMRANRKGSYSTLRPFSHSTLGPFSQFQHLCQLPLGCCTPGSWALDTTFPGYLLASQMSPPTFKLSQPPSLRRDNSPFHFSAEPFTTPICLSRLLVTLRCLALRGLLPGESSTVTRDFPL